MKRNYKNIAYYESVVQERLRDKLTLEKYERVKDKFNIGTTDTQSMRQQGLTKLEIREYWKREYKIITGEYEDEREWLFIKNYTKQLETNHVPPKLIKAFKDISRLRRNREYLISRVPDFAFWGYGKKSEDKKQLTASELDENVNDLLDVINRLRIEHKLKPIEIDIENDKPEETNK